MAKVAPLKLPGLSNVGGRAFINPHIRVGLTIYPVLEFGKGFTSHLRGSEKRDVSWKIDEREASLLTLKWEKHMGQAAGKWAIALKEIPGGIVFSDFEISDGDWIDITILRNGVKIPLCRGVIDTVRRGTSSAGGATVKVWRLTGRDHGAFFERPVAWNNYWLQNLTELTQGLMASRMKFKVGGRPDEMFQLFIDAAFGSDKVFGQWMLPHSLAELVGGSEKLHDILKVVSFAAVQAGEGLRGGYFNELALWTQAGQNLHQTILNWCNPLLNEVYYDLLLPKALTPENGLFKFFPVKDANTVLEGGLFLDPELASQTITSEDAEFGELAAIIRERPFPNTTDGMDSLWFNLPTWRLPSWLQETDDIGYGNQERYNVFALFADVGILDQNEQHAVSKPLWNQEDMKSRGLSYMEQHTKFIIPGSDPTVNSGEWIAHRKEWQQLMVDWYAISPYLLNGTKTYKTLLPEIRIGQRLISDTGNPDTEEQYYIEGVSIDYNAPQGPSGPSSGRTMFTLTRGAKAKDQEYYEAVKNTVASFEEME